MLKHNSTGLAIWNKTGLSNSMLCWSIVNCKMIKCSSIDVLWNAKIYLHTRHNHTLHCIALHDRTVQRPGAADPPSPRYRNFSCPLKARACLGLIDKPGDPWQKPHRPSIGIATAGGLWRHSWTPRNERGLALNRRSKALWPGHRPSSCQSQAEITHCYMYTLYIVRPPRCNFVWRICKMIYI